MISNEHRDGGATGRGVVSDNVNGQGDIVMPITTRRAAPAQEPSTETPARIAQRQRHIRILRACNLIARTKCGVAEAARSVGLADWAALQEVRDLCDCRRIPRRRKWGMPPRVWGTQEPGPMIVRPRE
jgi:hypothetical protein